MTNPRARLLLALIAAATLFAGTQALVMRAWGSS